MNSNISGRRPIFKPFPSDNFLKTFKDEYYSGINIKKPSILKSSKAKKNEELKNDKIIEPIKEEKTVDIEKDEPIIQKNDSKKRKSNNSINDLPTEEYFKATVQRALEQGLLNLAMMHPKDPFKFLGNYLIEYSKKNSTQ